MLVQISLDTKRVDVAVLVCLRVNACARVCVSGCVAVRECESVSFHVTTLVQLSLNTNVLMWVCLCVCVCARACVSACVRATVYPSVTVNGEQSRAMRLSEGGQMAH